MSVLGRSEGREMLQGEERLECWTAEWEVCPGGRGEMQNI